MKKIDDFEEFLKLLKEGVEKIGDETVLNRPIFIDISINICPHMDFVPAGIGVKKVNKIPVDVIETEKKIHAMIGLSGMEKENIKLSCNGNKLEITASGADKIITEMIELPARVIKRGMKATFENGILEIIFNKSMKKPGKKSNH